MTKNSPEVQTVADAKIDPYVQATLFAIWYKQVKYQSSKFDGADFNILEAGPSTGSIMKRLLSVVKKGYHFPLFDNLGLTISLCDQFLIGKVDADLMQKVRGYAQDDLEKIKPFAREFIDLDEGGGFGMPLVVTTFGHPVSLVRYIASKIDENGLVVRLSQEEKDICANSGGVKLGMLPKADGPSEGGSPAIV